LVTGLLDAGIPLKGIAHITGGGVVDNLGRLIKVSKNGASLTNLFPPDEPMRRVIEYGNVPLEKAYRYWNMGNGLLFIVGKEEAQAVLNAAARFPAYRVQSAGTIIAQRVIIINTGDETLQFTSFENK
jgi:phosphoribosylformylglycinamidine cyclo-ligase